VACDGGDDPVVVGPVITPGGANVVEAGEESGGMDVSGMDVSGMDVSGMDVSGMDNAGTPMGGMMAGTPMGGMPGGMTPPPCVDEEVGPDEEVFASTVGPSLIQGCAAPFCHVPDGGRLYRLPVSSVDFMPPLTGDLLAESIDASMEYINPGYPNMSALLSKAYNGHIGGAVYFAQDSAEYQQLAAWIEAMIECVPTEPPPPPAGMDIGGMDIGGMDIGGMDVSGMDIGGMDIGGGGGNTDVFCDLLPNGDPQNRADGLYYDQFANEVNNSLSMSCGRSGCHDTARNGFWLQASDDPCAIPANFLMTQAYINFVNADQSPILTAAYDPDHSGYQIYTGRSDPRFVALRNWVLLAFQ
jgi:hypothetical protein